MKTLLRVLLVPIVLVFLNACGNSSNGDPPKQEPARWDEMVWDRDKWS